jgi:hypothetical protein
MAKAKTGSPSPARAKRESTSPAGERGRKLKVFRTAIGFHDAYVAAPSLKAALEAWGADANIFAQGIAEQVEPDSEPAKRALAEPGTVVKALRGSAEDHVKALGKGSPSPRSRKGASRPLPLQGARGKKPSRAAVDKAEAALEERERKHRARLVKIEEEAEELRRRRRELERDYARERQALKEALRDEEARYDRAMDKWRG